jgi:hypothetical protein
MKQASAARIQYRLILCVLLSIAFLGSVPGAAQAQPQIGRYSCDVALNWVAAHRDNLPQTYEALSALHPVYRRAVYGVLSSTTKSALWRTQFERYLSRKNLTQEQRGLLLEAIQLSSPRTFDLIVGGEPPAHTRLMQYLDEFNVRSAKAFGSERVREIFGMIGPASVEELFFGAPEKSLSDSPSPDPSPSQPVACSCNRERNNCPSGYACSALQACNRITNGCGTILMSRDCDGLCLQPSPEPNPDPTSTLGQ